MSELTKDSAFKLFGKTITLQQLHPTPTPTPTPTPQTDHDSDVSLSHTSFASSTSQDTKDESVEGDSESTNPSEEKSSSSDMSDDPKMKDESSGLKKPDKIIPCPRCSSMDTKFCYFNNYNVNQPRHFCKKCQRYWTSGGTMRNVPVGSGRRKTKNALLPNYHDLMAVSSDSDILHTSLESNNWLISHHGFPVSFYPATLYWGSDGARNDNPPPFHQVPVVLGKRPREGRDSLDRVLVPKTLRIHDPIEAAKSSIWSTLGIKNDSLGLFKAFESKGEGRRGVGHRAMMLQANPAALSRSVNFQERA